MMCAPCKKAGQLLRSDIERELIPHLSIISDLHRHCEYPTTCTCQHILKSMIQVRRDG